MSLKWKDGEFKPADILVKHWVQQFLFSPFNAEAIFLKSTRTQRLLESI